MKDLHLCFILLAIFLIYNYRCNCEGFDLNATNHYTKGVIDACQADISTCTPACKTAISSLQSTCGTYYTSVPENIKTKMDACIASSGGDTPGGGSSGGGSSGGGSSKIVGGWCQCSYGHRTTWKVRDGANTIIAGGFQPVGSFGPCSGPSIGECTTQDIQALDGYTNKWLSVGGDGVGVGESVSTCLSSSKDLIKKFNMNGIAFDMEGCLNGKLPEVREWIRTNQSFIRDKNLKVIYVPQGDLWSDAYDNDIDGPLFDYVAPMFYGGADSYQGNYTQTAVSDMINFWTCTGICGRGYAEGTTGKGVPKSKLLLTYQSKSASSGGEGRNVLTMLSGKVKNEGYAGILGWSDMEDVKDTSNLKFIVSKL